VELLDFSKDDSVCQEIINFPSSIQKPVGGNLNGRPVICGGMIQLSINLEEVRKLIVKPITVF